MNVHFTRSQSPSNRELKQIQLIYEASFPPAESKPFELIAARLHVGEYLCYVTELQGSIVAFALLLPLTSSGCTFLEYIAVNQDHQSRGLGSELLRFIIGDLGSRLVWEVEPCANSDADDIRNRRLRFYERLGGQLIKLSTTYAMPNFEKGGDGIPLRLMQFPAGEQPDEYAVAAIVSAIYSTAYAGRDELRDIILRDLKTREPEA